MFMHLLSKVLVVPRKKEFFPLYLPFLNEKKNFFVFSSPTSIDMCGKRLKLLVKYALSCEFLQCILLLFFCCFFKKQPYMHTK